MAEKMNQEEAREALQKFNASIVKLCNGCDAKRVVAIDRHGLSYCADCLRLEASERGWGEFVKIAVRRGRR